MQHPPADEDLSFYAFTLTAADDGQVIIGAQTCWVGYQDDNPRIELRQPSLVNARMAQLWADIGQPCVFVVRPPELSLYFLLGGNALVERSIAEALVPDWLRAQPCHHDGLWGFVQAEVATAAKRAPSPKLRMQVLKRDKRRCRICGRTPDDDVDIVLNVHHIRPWANWGVTHLNNLITLCHTCHAGLDPHFDPSLFAYVHEGGSANRKDRFRKEVNNFRNITRGITEQSNS